MNVISLSESCVFSIFRMELPNIIVMVLDTARAKNFSCYGYQKETTPNIERIAQRSVLFENAYSPAGWTLPSHSSMLTGLYPVEIPSQISDLSSCKDVLTLPEMLKRIGYYTLGISSNYLVSDAFGFHKGFDRFLKVWQLFNSPHDVFYIKRQIKKDLFSAVKNIIKELNESNPFINSANLLYRKYYSDVIRNSVRTAEKATRIIQTQLKSVKNAGIPFFFFVNYMCAHNDYNPSSKDKNLFLDNGESKAVSQEAVAYYLGDSHLDDDDFMYLTKLYDAELHYADRKVGQIFEWLRQLDMLDNTLVIVTSDHGEHLGEHNHFNHLFSVYEEIIHIPLIIKYPGNCLNKKTKDEYTSLRNLVYLIDEVVSGKLEKSIRSIYPEDEEYIISSMVHQRAHFDVSDCGDRYERIKKSLLVDKFAVIRDGYKLIKNGADNYELYNIKSDPQERDNLVHHNSSLSKKSELADFLSDWLEKCNRKIDNKDSINARVAKRLKALGYM